MFEIVIIGFLIVMYLLTYRMSSLQDKQVKDTVLGFVEKQQQFNASDLKSCAVYSIVYRMLPHVFILTLLLNTIDKGFFLILCMLYLGARIFKASLQLIVLSKISSLAFAEKIIEGYKEIK